MTVVTANLNDLISRLASLARSSNNLHLIQYLARVVQTNIGPKAPGARWVPGLLSQLQDAENYLLTGGPWLHEQLPLIRQHEQQALGNLQFQLGETFRNIAQQHLQEQMFFQMREVAEQNTAICKENTAFLRRMSRKNETELKACLNHDRPDVRWAAAQVIGARRLHLEKDLIEHLDDPDPLVRQAAHAALVRLARGTDFGPTPLAVKSVRLRVQRQWEEWLAHEEKSVTGAYDLAVVADAGDGLGDEERRLRDQLLGAPEAKWQETLSQLRDGKGSSNTLALAAAAARLEDQRRREVRDALAERLSGLTAKTLRAYLKVDDPELRRAAALACAMKEDQGHIPDLLPLLQDEEPLVARAAHAALKSLTGKDFGPRPGAGPNERLLAQVAWQGWWMKQQHEAAAKR